MSKANKEYNISNFKSDIEIHEDHYLPTEEKNTDRVRSTFVVLPKYEPSYRDVVLEVNESLEKEQE